MSDQIEQGANVEEVAAPPSETIEHTEAEISEENPVVADPEPQRDFEKDKAFADMRRKAEEAERRASEADQWAKDNYGHLGIHTWKEYQQALVEQKKREEYAEKGIDYDEVRKIAKEEAEKHPDVINAKEKSALLEVNSEIRNLKAAYPDVEIGEIERLSDLRGAFEKLPNWEQIQQKVNRGYELKDAYELVNRDAIQSKRTAAAQQAERNKILGKNHLKPSGTAAAGEEITIPSEVLAEYRKMFPKKTDADFIAHYKKSRQQ